MGVLLNCTLVSVMGVPSGDVRDPVRSTFIICNYEIYEIGLRLYVSILPFLFARSFLSILVYTPRGALVSSYRMQSS